MLLLKYRQGERSKMKINTRNHNKLFIDAKQVYTLTLTILNTAYQNKSIETMKKEMEERYEEDALYTNASYMDKMENFGFKIDNDLGNAIVGNSLAYEYHKMLMEKAVINKKVTIGNSFVMTENINYAKLISESTKLMLMVMKQSEVIEVINNITDKARSGGLDVVSYLNKHMNPSANKTRENAK